MIRVGPKCPTGVATQDPLRQRALVVPDKAERVFNDHRNTLKALSEMLASIIPNSWKPSICAEPPRPRSQLHAFLEPGALLDDTLDDGFYAQMWRLAQAETFAPRLEEGFQAEARAAAMEPA